MTSTPCSASRSVASWAVALVVFTMAVMGGWLLLAWRNSAVPSLPSSGSSASTSHTGWLYRMLKYSARSFCGIVGSWFKFRCKLRRMALTIPGALGFLQWVRVSSTEQFTAALWGILLRNSI